MYQNYSLEKVKGIGFIPADIEVSWLGTPEGTLVGYEGCCLKLGRLCRGNRE